MTDAALHVFVPGKAVPGGSKKAFAHATTGKIIVTDDAKNNREWKERVAYFARQAFERPALLDGPLEVWATFYIQRPRSHYRVGRFAHVVRDSAPEWPIGRPDATKLWRAAEDALKGVVFNDDAQVVCQHIMKIWNEKPGVLIVVREVTTGGINGC
jgi:Holliday junction resolvase RusA-like endonuclease